MSEEIHSTSAGEAQKPPDNWIVDNLKKNAVTLFLAAAVGFCTFVYNSHDQSKDLTFQVQTLTRDLERLNAADKEKTETMNQFVIGLTKVSEAEMRIADDIKAIQAQQQKNTEMLINRK